MSVLRLYDGYRPDYEFLMVIQSTIIASHCQLRNPWGFCALHASGWDLLCRVIFPSLLLDRSRSGVSFAY